MLFDPQQYPEYCESVIREINVEYAQMTELSELALTKPAQLDAEFVERFQRHARAISAMAERLTPKVRAVIRSIEEARRMEAKSDE